MFGVRQLQFESLLIRIEILGLPILTPASVCASSIDKITRLSSWTTLVKEALEFVKVSWVEIVERQL